MYPTGTHRSLHVSYRDTPLTTCITTGTHRSLHVSLQGYTTLTAGAELSLDVGLSSDDFESLRKRFARKQRQPSLDHQPTHHRRHDFLPFCLRPLPPPSLPVRLLLSSQLCDSVSSPPSRGWELPFTPATPAACVHQHRLTPTVAPTSVAASPRSRSQSRSQSL